jgi:hypothetical protein
MKRLAFLPVVALALVACNDTATAPTSGPIPLPRASIAQVIVAANGPNGTHFQAGTSSDCTVAVDGLTISCNAYELAGVGNANAAAALAANYIATVDCRNHGGKVVPVKAQAKGAGVSTGELEPKNGRLEVPALTTGGDTPSDGDFIAQAVCPNGNWTKEVQDGSPSLSGFTYTLTFTGFILAYITTTGP